MVATRRASSSAAKATKDITQSAALIRALAEDRPDELEDALVEARARTVLARGCGQGARGLPRDAKTALGDAVGQHVAE